MVNPSSWATELCEDLRKQNNGKSRYSTSLNALREASEPQVVRGSEGSFCQSWLRPAGSGTATLRKGGK
ncbi:hypothetical protein J6590_007018 [Homalodisca vitripennis]|nr:hypothetical protein J6590_103207 [Homalodisca vitripennis]KAG8308034.1 hypothetical protein J6590_007018 [Homalodisca vitripennis]